MASESIETKILNRIKKCGMGNLLFAWFSVNLGGKQILQSLTIYLTINTLVNIIKLQMCVFFSYLCMCKKEQKIAHLQGAKVQRNLDSRK